MSEIDRESAQVGNRDSKELSRKRLTEESICSTVYQGITQRSTSSSASRLGIRKKRSEKARRMLEKRYRWSASLATVSESSNDEGKK